MPRFTKMKTVVVPCTLLVMLLGSLNASAVAAEAGEVVQRHVNFADLDLTRNTGAAVLYTRIKSAAGRVCDRVNARALGPAQQTRRCMDQAIARAVADVNAPELTSYYRDKARQPIKVAQDRWPAQP